MRRPSPKRDFHPEARARFREIQRTFSRRGLKDLTAVISREPTRNSNTLAPSKIIPKNKEFAP
jgi:hypothetical protein